MVCWAILEITEMIMFFSLKSVIKENYTDWILSVESALHSQWGNLTYGNYFLSSLAFFPSLKSYIFRIYKG